MAKLTHAAKFTIPKAGEGEKSGAYIKRLITLSTTSAVPITDDQIVEAVRKNFAGSKAKKSDVSWNRRDMRLKAAEPPAPPSNGNGDLIFETAEEEAESTETDEQIYDRIKKRFAALDRMAASVIKGVVPSLIVSGPAGLGKSFGVERALENEKDSNPEFDYDRISGSITAVGLYIALWNMKDGGVVVLDDVDDVFRDETALNILKAALDSNKHRRISWRKQANWLDEMGIPDAFDFNGRVIFLTNIDFERQAAAGKGLAVHFKALMDRSLYLHLAMRTTRDCMIRIRQVALETPMLEERGLDKGQVKTLLAYLEENKTRFFHLSLRLLHQVALCQIADPENWKEDVELTKMRPL